MRVVLQKGNKTDRFTWSALAFSALALLAALAPQKGPSGESRPEPAAPQAARAPLPAGGGPAAPTTSFASGRPSGADLRAAGSRSTGQHGGAARPGEPRVLHGHAAAPALALSAAVGPAARARARSTADALDAYADRLARRVAAFRAWGLKKPPPFAPDPPALKPRVRGARVVGSVPTDDRVVFLTIDDGARKSREFLQMVDDLDIPVTSFLTDEEVEPGVGYDYFRALADAGGTTQNHTLHHPYLPGLGHRAQRREICGQQDRIQEELGGPQPRLFRPPYGSYDRATLRAARACGIDAVVLWGMEAWADRIDFQEPGNRLYPGAIILTHYRGPASWGDGGTMADMLRRVLRLAADQGYAVARLEDYL
ncbi:polysaccharide deacetylase family protein [Streptomyces sp. TR06-5]|uniref:polysaccharide deacetylase family protein n=1 Tax=unclassified Streptomyces TaxID=2593676 RepID=UPI00399FD705